MSIPRIFISYSHDSDKHGAQVLALSERLRSDGFQTLLDQYVNGSPQQGWPRWMLDQLDTADFVLVVCSKAYYRRFRGHEEPGKGKGGDWEGALITQEIYNARSKTLKFVPVFLSAAFENWIPEPLRVHTHYALTSKRAYEHLCDFLLGVAGFEPSAIGALKKGERRKGTPLTFKGEAKATDSERQVDISRLVKYAPAELIGREAEIGLLNEAWAKAQSSEAKRPRILTFIGIGGEGKTSLVAKWAVELAHQGWPGCDAAFAWSFYSHGTREQMAASSDHFLKEALTFFGNDRDKAFAASAGGAYEKGQRLAHIIGQRRSLLILDGLEPLQYGATSPTPGQLKDEGIAALLKGVAAASRGLCVVTTRYSLPNLRVFLQAASLEVELQRLSRTAGVNLLQALGVRGTVQEFETLVEDVKGHALTLSLLGAYLNEEHAGNVHQAWRLSILELDRSYDTFTESTQAAFRQQLIASFGLQRDAAKVRGVRRGSCVVELEFASRDAFISFVTAMVRGDNRVLAFRDEWSVKTLRLAANVVKLSTAGSAESDLQCGPNGLSKPRVYLSYTWRTKGLKRRALTLAERLRRAGMDVRHDLFYAKSLHGFTPPDPLPNRDAWEAWQEEQIREADFVIVVCTQEYIEAPPSSGAWRDLRFMKLALESGRLERRRFIPVGFGAYGAIEPFIPTFMKGATYYNLSARQNDGLRFVDLVRRLETERCRQTSSVSSTPGSAATSSCPITPFAKPMTTRSIVWLHLSDLHNCKERTGWDAHRVLRPLIKDLKRMEKEHGLTPQLLFFTGDAAFGNIGAVAGATLSEQFDGAHELLEKVRTTFSSPVSQENVFIVPGNHDVDRNEVTPDQTAWITSQTQALVVNSLMQKAGKQWKNYMDRLVAYRDFLERHGYSHLLADRERLIYAQKRDVHGVKLGIAGFNSAWNCGGDGEKGKLWLGGDWQLGELLQHLDDADLRIALIHHPFGWFVEWEDTTLRIQFEHNFHFHLHGHEHLGWVDVKADGHVRVAAAASYDKSDTENGYNLVRLNLDTGEGEVWLRRYDPHGGGWVPRVVADKTNNDGCWRFGKITSSALAAPKTQTVNPTGNPPCLQPQTTTTLFAAAGSETTLLSPIELWPVTGDNTIDRVHKRLNKLEHEGNPVQHTLVDALRPLFARPAFYHVCEESPDRQLFAFCRTQILLEHYVPYLSNLPEVRRVLAYATTRIIKLQDHIAKLYPSGFSRGDHAERYSKSRRDFLSNLPSMASMKDAKWIAEANAILEQLKKELRKVHLTDW